MTQPNAITEIQQVSKVETDFHDLGMYGEYYGLIIHFNNGKKFTLRIQEHDFNYFNQQAETDPEDYINKQQEEHDLYLAENLHDNGEMKVL